MVTPSDASRSRPALTATTLVPRAASLERRLPFMISALLAVSIATYGFLAFTEVRRSSAAAAIEQSRTIIAQLADVLARNVEQRFDVLLHTASSPAVTNLLVAESSPAHAVEAGAFLRSRRTVADNAALLSQLVVQPDGTNRFRLGETPSAAEVTVLRATMADAGRRDNAVISTLFAVGTEMHYWLVVPSHAGTAPVGFLAEQRRLRTSPQLDQQIKDLTGQAFSFYYADSAGQVWTGPSARPIAPRFDIKATPDTFRLAANDGVEIMGIKAHIKGTPWVIVLSMTQAAVNHRSMVFLRRMLLIGAAVLAVGLLAAWWMSRRVTQPLISLATAARAAAEGDFAHREQVRTNDELGQLARAFNIMAERVGQRNEDLQVAQQLATDARVASDRARADAQRASEAKTEFLAMMSHELRTPLSAIAGYAEILQLGLHGELNDRQHVDVGRIQANQVHLLRIINDILDLTQVESGQMAVELQPVALQDVISDLDPIIMPLIRGRDIRYSVHASVLPLTVRAERERLTQILVNLVANASRFTEAGNSIILHADSANDRVRLHVTDAGVGIPSDKHELIFQPFVQLDGGPSRQAQGTGLGLAISRRIAEAMGGTLTVRSELGEGATFTLDLATVEIVSHPPRDSSNRRAVAGYRDTSTIS